MLRQELEQSPVQAELQLQERVVPWPEKMLFRFIGLQEKHRLLLWQRNPPKLYGRQPMLRKLLRQPGKRDFGPVIAPGLLKVRAIVLMIVRDSIIQSSDKSRINKNGCEENSEEQSRLQREHKSCAMSVAFGLLGVLPVAGDILHAGIAAKRAMSAQKKLVGVAEDAMGLGSTVANGANNRPFFYGLYRKSALTSNDEVAKRAMERFKADPGSVVGVIDTAPVKLQSQSDRYLHALYHSPQNRALRDSMTYEEFMFRSNEVLRSNEAANKLVNSKGASIAEVMESFQKSVYSSGVLESEKKLLLEAMNKGHMNLSGKGMNTADDFKKVIQNNEGNPVILALDVDKEFACSRT